MILPIIYFFLVLITFFFSCSENERSSVSPIIIEQKPYNGTYLLKDTYCSGNDIQYLIIDVDKVSIFDYLGDSCDDTVECYSVKSFNIIESFEDTTINFSSGNNEIVDGIIHVKSDSTILVRYESSDGGDEETWEKVKNEVFTFTPLCNQTYENTKDLADILVYAVSDGGDILWESYLHEGAWDIGASITPLMDGGYMVFGQFDAIEWGGCCYTEDAGARDIIKLNSQGIEQWRKEINYNEENNTALHYSGLADIGNSLIQTSRGDLVVIAPGLDHYANVLMMDTLGNVIWTKSFSGVGGDGLYSWSGHHEILETKNGDLAIIGGFYVNFLLLDYTTGNIIEQKEYVGLKYAKAIISDQDNFVMIGMLNDPENSSNRPLFLQKVSNRGDVIWRRTWEEDSTRTTRGHDLIHTSDNGYLLFCNTDPWPYATLIKTNSNGNEEWRKRYPSFTGGRGWIHKTEDGGYFLVDGGAVMKLDMIGNIEWNAGSDFYKYFNNGVVKSVHKDMRKIDGGAVITGYGSRD